VTAKTSPRGAIDPRIQLSRRLILEAALSELGEAGFGAFTIESVTARSGVAKSTIYRHWPDKLALISDAFRTFHEQEGPDLNSGSTRERLARIVRHVAQIVGASVFSACIPALIDGAERNDGLRNFHHQFQIEARRPLVALIADGVATGDLPGCADPELAAAALLGAIFYRRLMTDKSFDPDGADDLIDTIFGSGPQAR
jgi:TetR/AcrR family transcriptional regulator of autoinduction and epiphytic fitness